MIMGPSMAQPGLGPGVVQRSFLQRGRESWQLRLIEYSWLMLRLVDISADATRGVAAKGALGAGRRLLPAGGPGPWDTQIPVIKALNLCKTNSIY